MIFISNYIKKQKVPKGFRLTFYCYTANVENENTIKKCSSKLMQRTVNNYKRSILTIKTDFDKLLAKINCFHFNRGGAFNI